MRERHEKFVEESVHDVLIGLRLFWGRPDDRARDPLMQNWLLWVIRISVLSVR